MYRATRVCKGCGNLVENTSAHSQRRANAIARQFEKEGRVCKSCASTAKNNKRWEDRCKIKK